MGREIRRLTGLNDFDAAARHGSFSGAADELLKTPAAVSMQIKQLEAALGFRLFERRPRGVVLTARGRELAATVHGSLSRIEEKISALRRTDPEHETVISTTHSFAIKWLAPRLPRLAQRHPDIDVRINATDQLVDVEHECDVAIRHSSKPIGESLSDDWLVPVVSSSLACGSLVEALGLPLLHEGDTSLWEAFLELQENRKLVTAGRSQRYSHAALLVQAACAGSGIALAPFSIACEDIAQGRLKLLPSVPMRSPRSFFLVTKQGPARAAVAKLLDWLRSEGRSMEAVFAALAVLAAPPPLTRA